MRSTTIRPVLAVLAATALTVTLASCSGSDSDDAATAATDGATATETTPAEDETTAETTAPAEASGDVASCIIGDWEMDADALKEQIGTLLGGMATNVEVEGTNSLSFDETTVTMNTDSSASFSVDLGADAGGAVSGANTTKGNAVLAYTVSGNQFTYGAVQSADGTATSTITQGDSTPQTTETSFADYITATVGSTSEVACDADTLSFISTLSDQTVTQTYTRR